MRNYAAVHEALLRDLSHLHLPGLITSDCDVKLAACQQLVASFYKKLRPLGDSPDADAAALKKFEGINRRLRDQGFDPTPKDMMDEYLLDYFKGHLNRCVQRAPFEDNFDVAWLANNMIPGPRAAQKADSTSMMHKLFFSELSYRSDHALAMYRAALSQTGWWAEAEMSRFHRFGVTRVEGASLFFAKKNADISRVCCTESSVEMILQKGVSSYLESCISAYHGIDLTSQPGRNAQLARLGSIDGSFGTIDSESASDSIHLDLVKWAFDRSPLKTMILETRSPLAILPDGRKIELSMVSTMGNGYTFTLQTLIFASAVRAVYDLMGIRERYGVFGDDVIVVREAYPMLIKFLGRLGFVVNHTKSFNSGPFRESCGSDWYRGYNIRGVYIQSLETEQHVYSAVNRLARWSGRHGVPLDNTLRLLLSWVRFFPVPPTESDDAGVKVPWRFSHRVKVDDSYSVPYKCWVRRGKRFAADTDSMLSEFNGLTNPLGVGCAFLSGWVRRPDVGFNVSAAFGSASTRSDDDVAHYRVRRRTIPWWDFQPLTWLEVPARDGSWRWATEAQDRGWETAVGRCLDS